MQHLAIVRDGKARLFDKPAWDADVARYDGKQVVIEVRTRAEKRSDQQNDYWWGVVVEFFRAQWTRERRDSANAYTKEQAHEVLVEYILGFEDGPHGTRIRKRTRDLTTADFSTLIEHAKEMAWQDYQARIPDPSEPKDGL